MNWLYLWLSFISLFILGLAENARGPVFPDLLREFSLSDSLGALFFFVSSAFGLGNNLLSGFWLPRLGPYRSLQAFLFLQIAGYVAVGMSRTYAGALAGVAVFGLAHGGVGICMNILVGQGSRPEFRRQAYSALHCMYGVASLLAPLTVSVAYQSSFGWRETFLALAIAPLALLLVSFVGSGRKAPLVARRLVHEPRRRKIAAVWICMTLSAYVVAEVLVSSRLVLLSRREFGMDPVEANAVLARFFMLLFLGRLAFVFLPNRWSPLALMKVSAASSFVILGTGLLGHPGIAALSGLTMAPFFPAAMAYLHELFYERTDGVQAWALTSNALGLMLMHAVTGGVSDLAGLKLAMWIGPICLGGAWASLLWLEPRFRKYAISP